MPGGSEVTWLVWGQGPLLLLVLLATWTALRDAARDAGADVRTVGAAAALVFLALLLYPPGAMVGEWSGHQSRYQALLAGTALEEGTFVSTVTFPVPAGVAWSLGALLPARVAELAWLLGNRLALGVAGFGVAVVAGLLAREDTRTPARYLALGLLFLSPTVTIWSAAGFAVSPAVAAGALGLVLAVRGRPFAALAWAALAMGIRPEALALLAGLPVVALAFADRASLRRDLWTVPVGLGAVAVQWLALSAKRHGLPIGHRLELYWENLGLIPLGGPLFDGRILVLGLAVVLLARLPALRLLRLVAWALALLACVGQLPAIMDLGARHFLPPTLLLVPLFAAALAAAVPPREAPRPLLVAGALLAAGLVGLGLRSHADWKHRYSADDPLLPRWIRAADAGVSGSFDEVLDPSCLVYLPDGERTWPGARDVFDVGNVQVARWEMQGIVDEGGTACVQWASRPWVRFTGDAQLEYLDRAVRMLELTPVGWIEDPPDDSGRWILFEGRL